MAQYNPPRIEDNANYLQGWMRQITRNVFTLLNDTLQQELHFDNTLFVEPLARLLRRSYLAGEQPILIAKQISELTKQIARENGRDAQMANYVATVLAVLAGDLIETMDFKILALTDIEAVVNPAPGLPLPRTPVGAVAQQPGFNRERYEEDLERNINELRQRIFTDLTNKFTIIREIHIEMLVESIGRTIIPIYSGNPVISAFIAEDLMPLLTRIIGHVFSTEGPYIIENLRRIYVLSTAQPFDRNAAQKAGVIKFTGAPSELLRLSADNLEDLKQYSPYPLEAINAYAYWKLLLYAPPQAWQEVVWMKNLVSSIPSQWWENPAKRFDFFINAWILDTLSRVNELRGDLIRQKIVRWKALNRLPAGTKGKIAISRTLLAEIGLFDAFFKIDYQMIFPEAIARDDINPFRFLLDDEIGDEFINDHFLQGIMIDCAKQALCVYAREAAIIRKNNIRTYNGTAVPPAPELIISEKRVDLRGLRYFLDFVDEKFLSPAESLSRSSVDFFSMTEVMGTFMNYVSIYAFRNGMPPGGRGALQWTAGRSPILAGGRGRRAYQVLLTYLDELRERVENNQPLCNTTPNVYLDIPVIRHEPAPTTRAAPALTTLALPPTPAPTPALPPTPALSAPARPLATARSQSAERHVVFADPSLALQRPLAQQPLVLGGFSKNPTSTTPLLARPAARPMARPPPSIASDPAEQSTPLLVSRSGLRPPSV